MIHYCIGCSTFGGKRKRDLEIYVSFKYRLYDETEGSVGFKAPRKQGVYRFPIL